ncbi:hypothetical protein [uncultured Selenomonas sp.]|uniref:hypothetical protein n=1 Tax=uncultured Selenomonas sp. TaxID=159275 RepID=UPI0025D2A11B|nr:hypothetical protein [uncultured Selenomonas sp.]
MSGVPEKEELRKQPPLHGSETEGKSAAAPASYETFNPPQAAVCLEGERKQAEKSQGIETDKKGHLRRLRQGIRRQSWGAVLSGMSKKEDAGEYDGNAALCCVRQGICRRASIALLQGMRNPKAS